MDDLSTFVFRYVEPPAAFVLGVIGFYYSTVAANLFTAWAGINGVFLVAAALVYVLLPETAESSDSSPKTTWTARYQDLFGIACILLSVSAGWWFPATMYLLAFFSSILIRRIVKQTSTTDG